MSNYLLASNAEKERLQLQARVWQPEAEIMLDRIGVQSGWSCADIGCGAMGILEPLSRRVGLEGRVVGIDRDATLLAAARVYLQEEALTNIELLERDVSNIELPPDTFDLVHERFLLPHVASPENVLRRMIALTKPGGIIVAQEPDNTSWNFLPMDSGWSRLKEIIIAAFALRGNIDIGQQTFLMFKRAGLKGVTIRAAVLALQDNHPYMRMSVTAVAAMRQHIVSSGLATEEELDYLLANVEARANDPETCQITFTVTQVWGRKPLVA